MAARQRLLTEQKLAEADESERGVLLATLEADIRARGSANRQSTAATKALAAFSFSSEVASSPLLPIWRLLQRGMIVERRRYDVMLRRVGSSPIWVELSREMSALAAYQVSGAGPSRDKMIFALPLQLVTGMDHGVAQLLRRKPSAQELESLRPALSVSLACVHGEALHMSLPSRHELVLLWMGLQRLICAARQSDLSRGQLLWRYVRLLYAEKYGRG